MKTPQTCFKSIRLVSGLLSLLICILLFQNCVPAPVNFSPKDKSESENVVAGGNGEGYDAKITYYYAFNLQLCKEQKGFASSLYSVIRKTDHQYESIFSNCAEQSPVALDAGQISFSPSGKELSFNGQIYLLKEEDPSVVSQPTYPGFQGDLLHVCEGPNLKTTYFRDDTGSYLTLELNQFAFPDSEPVATERYTIPGAYHQAFSETISFGMPTGTFAGATKYFYTSTINWTSQLGFFQVRRASTGAVNEVNVSCLIEPSLKP